ncbi:MAG: hypothetical protein NUV47_02885 [Patescibacteria group bacterium]|nr:hypothetical protein [Patescibacteria group bacterium]
MNKNGWNIIILSLAILVGSISVAPHLLAVQSIGTEYKGIPFLYLNNEFGYASRIQEISDGHFFIGSSNFFEYKNIIPVVPPSGEYTYYILHLLTGLSVLNTIVLAKFLFPAILFLLIYLLVSKLIKDSPNNIKKIGAITAGIFVTLGYDLVDFRTVLMRLFTDTDHNTYLSLWTRPVNPIVGAIFLFSFLILILNIIENKNRKTNEILTGLTLALTAGYFFSFALAWIILFLLTLRFLWKRNYAVIKAFSVSALIAIIIDFFYWLNALKSVAGNALAVANRNGLLHFHTPILNKVLIVATLIFIILIWKKPKNETIWFCGIMLVSGFIAFNQQIITGLTIWPYHFVQYTIPFSVIIVITICGNILGNKYQKYYIMSCIGISSLVFIFALWNIPTYKNSIENFRNIQPVGQLFSWLNNNAEKDCVVLVDEQNEYINEMLPAVTHCNVYRSLDINSGIPVERTMWSYLIKLRQQGLTLSETDSYLNSHKTEVTSYFFTDWDNVFGKKDNPELENIIKKVSEQYKSLLKKDFSNALSKYKLDYIITTKKLDSSITPILQVHNDYETFSLYKFTSAKR